MAPAQLGEDALDEASRLGGEQLLGGLGLGELGLGSTLAVVVGRRRGEGRQGGAGDGVLGSARRGLPHERHGARGGDAVVDAEGGVGNGGGVLGEETPVGYIRRPLLLHGGQERLLA